MAGRNQKEALYIQVPAPDGAVEFHDATGHVGRKSPFKSPKMVCGMSVGGMAVSFNLLMLTKKSASGYAEKDLSIPRPSLYRLSRYAAENPVADNKAIIEYEGSTQTCDLIVGEGGVAELDPTQDDINLDLPKGAVRITVVLKTGTLDRPIAVGFVGYPGKPGTPTSARRIASMALYNLSLLAPFRLLSGIETVAIPAGPRASAPPRSRIGEAGIRIPVWLFSDTAESAPEAIGSGEVEVSIDLDHANPTTGRPVVHLEPSEGIAEIFEKYRRRLSEAVSDLLFDKIGSDGMRSLTVSIVLGDIAEGHVGMLNEALKHAERGYDLTPSAHQLHA